MKKSRIIMITTILTMVCIVWLVRENRAYKTLLNEQQIKEAELLDQFFDLQYEYERCFSAVYNVEYGVDSLGYVRDTALNGSYPIP